MDLKSPSVLRKEEISLECAPVGKYARLVHEFAVKRHLPPALTTWAFISIPCGIAIFMLFFWARAEKLVVSENYGLESLALIPLLLLLAYVLSRPTHVGVAAAGVFKEWRRTIYFRGKVLPWSELVRISVVNPSKASRVEKRVIRFQGKDRFIDLKVNEVADLSQMPFFYDVIIAQAPDVPRDAEVQSLLGHDKANASYTELWLKALTAPPERSRLVPLEPGTTLQDMKYRVKERIGAGGQGVAYSATTGSGDDEKLIVLKEYILPVGVSHGSKVESLEKFQGEAEILSTIDHPQIVKLLDFFFEDHRAYMVLEFVEGSNLQALAKKDGIFEEKKIIDLAIQMAEILEYLHSKEPAVIHRDFSPDNLILGSTGLLKLIDFNVAKQQKASATATVVGKHAYISPDQFRGDLSPLCDIYSLGATLFFVCTGQEPKPITVAHPRLKNPQISEQLDEIVAACTAISPESRLQSASKLKNMLLELKKTCRGLMRISTD